jgi:hypothetical protein
MYNWYLKDFELKRMTTIGWTINILMLPLYFILIFRKNLEWGIPDTALLFVDDTIYDVIHQAFVFLPMTVLYAKITPPHIEATCFAFLASA